MPIGSVGTSGLSIVSGGRLRSRGNKLVFRSSRDRNPRSLICLRLGFIHKRCLLVAILPLGLIGFCCRFAYGSSQRQKRELSPYVYHAEKPIPLLELKLGIALMMGSHH